MGIRRLATLLPMVAPARSRGHPALERTRGLRNLQPDTTISAPIYTPEECDRWVSTLVDSDENKSEGLSESEYHAFLSDIEDPPYIAAYFKAYEGFDQLPWVFRVVHKSLACHCEKLGYGEECCEGDDSEILLQGLKDDGDGGTARNGEEEEYKDLFCQQIAYALTKSIPSPAPTDGPSISPTRRPSSGPTASPSMGPSVGPTAAPVTGIPTIAPSAEPTAAAAAPEPTDAPSVAPSAALPVEGVAIRTTEEDEEDGTSGVGLIIGIIAACLALLVAIVAFVAHRRRVNEQDQLRKFAGDQAPDADLEAAPTAAPTAAEDSGRAPAPGAAADAGPPGPEPDEDDESSAPSVWSEGDDKDAPDELHEDREDPGATAGSALAAMGAASTVAARIGANGNSD